MAITRVQTAVGGGDGGQGTSVAAVFGSNVTAGNYGIVGIRQGSDTLTGVTDTLGTTYTLVGSSTGAPSLYVYQGKFPSSGANTVTASFSSTNFPWVFAIEVSGLAASSVLDTFDVQTFTGVFDITTDAITTTQNDAYVVMFASQNAFAAYTAGTDFTLIDGTIPTNPNNFGGVEERITTSTLSSYTPHITSTVTDSGAAIVAAFKADTGGGGEVDTAARIIFEKAS